MVLRFRIWLLFTSFPLLRRPRRSRGLRPGCGCVRWVALCDVPLVGMPLVGWAFRGLM